MPDEIRTTNLWGGADPVERTKADPNRSYREDALVEEIERLRRENLVLMDSQRDLAIRVQRLEGYSDGLKERIQKAASALGTPLLWEDRHV